MVYRSGSFHEQWLLVEREPGLSLAGYVGEAWPFEWRGAAVCASLPCRVIPVLPRRRRGVFGLLRDFHEKPGW